MRPVLREDIVDLETYERMRPAYRDAMFSAKAPRRVHLGDHFTFLFENPATIRYQVLEMMRAERLTRDEDIRHELETYNGLLGGDGELGCTLLVEIDDPAVRAVRLREWFGLPEHVYARLEDGTTVRPSFDESQRGDGRLSSVQYLKFPVGETAPVALGIDLPGLQLEMALTPAQRAALAEDLNPPPDAAAGSFGGPAASQGQEALMTVNIGISDQNRRAVGEMLNRLLADEYVLYTKTRNYHWNVVGPQFVQLHEFFEKQYEKLDDVVDDVAERSRSLGQPVVATLAEFSKLARLQERTDVPDARGMLAALLADHEAIVRQLRADATACAERLGDIGTSDFLTGLLEDHEKTAWMLRALLATA
jgi:DNA-binding ferritin-like protein